MKGVLKVLMWKHLIVRMRRFIHTPVEIIAPILLFILYYLFKDQIASIPPVNTYNDGIQQTESVEINSVSNPVEIYYTPETDFTNRLMKLVENYYVLHPPPNTFVANAKPSIKPLQNTSMLQKPPHGVAVVIFKGLDLSDEKPPKLTYTIRMYEDFKTYSYISEDVYIGPHYGFGTVYETFMKLQWAVDSGYLKILGDRDIPENVVLKEFPYKKSHQDYTATLVAEMMATICSLSLLLVFVFLMARLLEERVTGIQELIKMVGVSNTMLSISHVLNCAPTCLVFAVVPAILLTISSTPVLQNTNIILIMILLALYFISIMSMAFVCSYIVNNDQYTVTIAVFSYIFLSIPTRVVLGVGVPRWLLPICGLLPHMPMEWFWKESGALQQFGLGLNFGNMASTHTASTMSALACYLYLIVQSIIFFALSWYLSYVRPGPYGQPLPWNFICNEAYWGKTKVTPQESEELEELEEAEEINPEYFDQPIKDAEVGIKVVNVTKVFGKNRALHNVSLDVYKGEITVLLGHNGAGKTTLMSIITGMLKPTEGKVYVEGFDTDTQKDEMRKHLGLCPQHNLFFKDLTILEHVIFFTMIKGIPYGKAKESSTKLLEQLNLGDKLQERSSSLSGGMKRRLQLACALAGDARVLVLDEPTSGLDVETRRELWDLLLSLSASRTVLLSTHFMEEAEALGERVAALRAGRLQCRASTMRLKRAIGSGYRLSFTTIGLPNEPALTAAILSVIPEASLKETSLNSISYNLPAKNTDKFPKLFNLLESKRSELGINTIGVGVSTLEEVFLKLCSDITTTFTDDTVDGETEEVEQEIVTGFHLCTQQLLVLLKRQLKYLWSKKISFIIMQVILPILLIIVFTLITNNRFYDVPEGDGKQTLAMDLNMYEPMTDRRALYSVNSDKYNIDNVKKRNPKVAFENTDDVAKAVLRVGTKDTMEYNKYLVGVELNDTDAKILFTTVVRHAAPVALNLLSNLLASRNGHSITTYNDPAYENTYRETRKNEPKHMGLLGLWSFMLVFTILATVANSASLPCKERESGARHLHVMAGCAPALHWLATLLAHSALHTLALVLPTLAIAAALEQDATIDQGDFLAVLAFVMILGIMAFLSLIYLVSFVFGERGAGVMLVGIIVIFGFIFPLLSQMPRNDGTKTIYYFLDTSSYLMPPHAFSMAVLNLAGIARENVTPDTPRRSSWAIDDYSPGLYVLLLFVQFVVLMTLVILTEYGVFNSCCDRFFNVRYVPSTPANVDRMVAAEKLYVNKAIALPPKQIQDAMLVNDLHKNYPSLFRRSCNAVRGVSFSVKPGECFGLLGVNGAGKSTTFKMLTAVECPTRGSIFSNGHFMKMLSGEYLRSLGYCPQTQALDEFLSGRDNIVLLLTLRGVAPHQLKEQTDKWINIVGLERYATRALSTYSGGCARRLSAAAALCAGTCTLLDEPTAGVDVAARRRLWAAVRRAARVRALVVCSHSMDEMEALCGRIAIMSRGRIRALGEAAELRAAHGAGHALTLKLYHRPRAAPAAPVADVDETDSAMTDLNHLKATLREKFNCTLRDEHSTTLHYHINDTMIYSDLFAALERLKEKFPNLLEDYSVTETTLEEVFLSFAKEEVNEGPTPV